MISELLQLLRECDDERRARVRSLKGVLPESAASGLPLELLDERRIWSSCHDELLSEVAKVVEHHPHEEPPITDWPFAHFWDNPYEPCHSKLLAYFINPAYKHGEAFLRQLLISLGKNQKCNDGAHRMGNLEVDKACRVEPEQQHIDILITRYHADQKPDYAVIIENKVNSAKDQGRQLENYRTYVIDELGFRPPAKVFVVYLPLTNSKVVSDEGLGNLCREDVIHASFKEDIAGWLREVLASEPMDEGMRDNLRQYHNLLNYLLREERLIDMKEQVLKKLRDRKTGELPTWHEIENLVTSAEAFRECYQAIVHADLLTEIDRELWTLGVRGARHYWPTRDESKGEPETYSRSLYLETPFEVEHCVDVFISEDIGLGFGVDEEGLYVGYSKPAGRDKEECAAFRNKAISNMPSVFAQPDGNSNDSDHWYAYWYFEGGQVLYGKPLSQAQRVARHLQKMYHEMNVIACELPPRGAKPVSRDVEADHL